MVLLSVSSRASINTTLATWNLVTSSNLTHVNDIEGRAFVGGNATLSSGFQVGNGNSSVSKSTVTLAVQGNIKTGGYINLNGGSITAGGTISAAGVNKNSGGTVTAGSSYAANNSPVAELTRDSKYWSTLKANGTITENAASQYVLNTPSGSSLAVFDVTDTSFFENSTINGYTLNVSASTTTILINVYSQDGTVNWTKGDFFDLFQTSYWKGRVLFNFYNATTVNLHDQITGYVVAPYATVTENNNIDGGVFAENLYVGSEVHLPDRNTSESSWYGDLPDAPTDVPEPAGYGLASALGLLSLCTGQFLLPRLRKNRR